MGRSLRFASLAGFVAALSVAGARIPPYAAYADDSATNTGSLEDQYLQNLKIAQSKVLRVKKARLAAASLSSPIIKSIFGRYYRAGDSWDVAAFQFMNPMARMTSDPAHLKMEITRSGIFHYEVVSVKNDASPEVVMRVTQRSAFGLAPVDPRVQTVTLTMNDQMLQTRKSYQLVGNSRPVAASPNGIHSSISPLELFPLDVPEILTASRTQATALPELPPEAQAIARKSGYQPDLAHSSWFEQDDFFGRPIQLLWQQGNPWPTYLKTANGVAVLISKRPS